MLETLFALCCLLTLILAATIFWALKFRMRKWKEVDSIARAISTFERDGLVILRIEKINPDHLYLRSQRNE